LKKIKKGITEKELAYELEYLIKQKGADISFPPIVAFGANSSIPHHQTSDKRLKANSIVLLDFGAKLGSYCSDMTRTIFFGKANNKFKKMYKTVLDAQKKAIEKLSHLGGGRLARRSLGEAGMDSSEVNSRGIKASVIDKIARDYIIKQGFPTIPHSLGHGIGIEVHEPPRLSPTSKVGLKPGMVFSIEPGIYMPGFGGIRIEDLVVLENKDPRLLTHSPKELIEI
jgi:Xaa-Pro aminopeptidase